MSLVGVENGDNLKDTSSNFIYFFFWGRIVANCLSVKNKV